MDILTPENMMKGVEVDYDSTKEIRTSMEMDGRIIGLAEAAEILNVSYSTARRMAIRGDLPAFHYRGIWKTSDAACRVFIAKQFRKQALICQATARD